MFDPLDQDDRRVRIGIVELLLILLILGTLIGGGGFFIVLRQRAAMEREIAMMHAERAQAAAAQANATLAQANALRQQLNPDDASAQRAGEELIDDICHWRWRDIYFRSTPRFSPDESLDDFSKRLYSSLTLPRTVPGQRPERKVAMQRLGPNLASIYGSASPRSGAMPIQVQAKFEFIDGEWRLSELDVTQDK